MGLFGSRKISPGTADQVKKLIENFFDKIRLNPHQQQISSDKGYGWMVARGSALVYLFVQEWDGVPMLRIVSPLVYLPQDNLLPFYRKLLDLSSSMVNCSLALDKDVVICVASRPTLGLDQEELDAIVNSVATAADTVDHQLAEEFGARIYSEQP